MESIEHQRVICSGSKKVSSAPNEQQKVALMRQQIHRCTVGVLSCIRLSSIATQTYRIICFLILPNVRLKNLLDVRSIELTYSLSTIGSGIFNFFGIYVQIQLKIYQELVRGRTVKKLVINNLICMHFPVDTVRGGVPTIPISVGKQ